MIEYLYRREIEGKIIEVIPLLLGRARLVWSKPENDGFVYEDGW